MEDQKALVVRLRRQADALRYSLESLGAAERLNQRGRIADVERRISGLLAPADVAPAGAESA